MNCIKILVSRLALIAAEVGLVVLYFVTEGNLLPDVWKEPPSESLFLSLILSAIYLVLFAYLYSIADMLLCLIFKFLHEYEDFELGFFTELLHAPLFFAVRIGSHLKNIFSDISNKKDFSRLFSKPSGRRTEGDKYIDFQEEGRHDEKSALWCDKQLDEHLFRLYNDKYAYETYNLKFESLKIYAVRAFGMKDIYLEGTIIVDGRTLSQAAAETEMETQIGEICASISGKLEDLSYYSSSFEPSEWSIVDKLKRYIEE